MSRGHYANINRHRRMHAQEQVANEERAKRHGIDEVEHQRRRLAAASTLEEVAARAMYAFELVERHASADGLTRSCVRIAAENLARYAAELRREKA